MGESVLLSLSQLLLSQLSLSQLLLGGAGVTMSEFLVSGKSGRSRQGMLVQYRVVAGFRSWWERVKAASGGAPSM